MSDIIEELLESFRSSSNQLEGLSEGLEELQKAQVLVQNLSSNLNEAATALRGTATSHDNFIKSAQTTNSELGEIIQILKGLDTKTINTTLAQIMTSLNNTEGMLTKLENSLTNVDSKASAADQKLGQITSHLDAVIAANASLSKELSEVQKTIIDRTDGALATVSGRQKQIMLAVLLSLAASGALVANLFGVVPL